MNPGGLFVSSSGIVGIGNIVPAYTLDVSGTGRFSSNVNIDGEYLTIGGTSNNAVINNIASVRINLDSNNNNTGESFTVGHNQTVINDSNVLFRVVDNGNVAISTISPNIGGYGANSRVLTIQGVSGSYGVLELTSNSANADGSAIGRLDFGSDGQAANYKAISSIASFLSGSTSTKFGADLRFYTRIDNAGSGDPSERIRITAAGNVGIGATNITGKLMIYQGSAGNVFQSIVSNQGGSTRVGINFNPSMSESDVAAYQAQSAIYATDYSYSADIIFATKVPGAYANSLTERMRITSAGYVGIDTDGTTAKLGIGRTANTESNIFLTRNTTTTNVNVGCIRSALGPFWYDATSTSLAEINLQTDTTAYYRGAIAFSTNNSDATANRASLRMYINAAGSIGTTQNGTNIYNASDIRLKKNIATIENSLSKVLQLNPVKFNWVDGFAEDGKDMLGFIAQEVQNIIPEAVEAFSGEDNIVEIGDLKVTNPLRINEKFIIPVLVKALQEANAKITSLEEKLERNNII
jgi:hypothetical protein